MNINSTKGKVYLVGAGPGDPELLTLKAARILRSAEVVLHDDLVSREVLDLIPKTAQLHNVGKRCGRKSWKQSEINTLLVQLSSLGADVTRLKGGDPLIFGRAGEELEALREAGIEVEIIPGVSSALAAAAAAQIPVTHRDLASSIVFLAGHHAQGQSADGVIEHLSAKTTYAIYMPGYGYATMSERLEAAGLCKQTPCAIVSQVATPGERVFRTTLGELATAPQLPPPTLLFVGEVVRMANHPTLASEAAWWTPEAVTSASETPESFANTNASTTSAIESCETQESLLRGD
jgi:uroporphyrin-III C-methyltransferase